MISLLSVTFNSEIPARNSNISQGLFYIPVIISTFEIQKFRTFWCVCSFSPFFFSLLFAQHIFSIKKKGRKMWKKSFLVSCPSPFHVLLSYSVQKMRGLFKHTRKRFGGNGILQFLDVPFLGIIQIKL